MLRSPRFVMRGALGRAGELAATYDNWRIVGGPVWDAAMLSRRPRFVATDQVNTATVPGRYASALFALAQDQNSLADVERDLASLQEMIGQSDDLQRLILSPVYSSEQQTKALSAIMDQAGMSALTANFVKLLARNRRLFAITDIIQVFRKMAAAARGEVEAQVTSATPLTEEQRQSLMERLRVIVGRDVQLNTSIDPNILGGLIVKVGSRMIDTSLRTKLAMLKVRMKEAS